MWLGAEFCSLRGRFAIAGCLKRDFLFYIPSLFFISGSVRREFKRLLIFSRPLEFAEVPVSNFPCAVSKPACVNSHHLQIRCILIPV